MNAEQKGLILSAAEQRVIGVLIEKSRVTPDNYPMTLNGIVTACNQKTSRFPVVDYDEETVSDTLNSLKKKSLVSTVTGGSSRTVKYKHNLGVVFPLVPAELVVLGLLLLRGPQTPGEINNNSGRMYEFTNLEEVVEILNRLSENQPPFVRQLERRPGQKEQRYTHLLGESAEEFIPKTTNDLEARVTALEEELAALKTALKDLLN